MNKYEGLTHIVQVYCGHWWRNIAAFDNKTIADRYAEDCIRNGLPVGYRVIEVVEAKEQKPITATEIAMLYQQDQIK